MSKQLRLSDFGYQFHAGSAVNPPETDVLRVNPDEKILWGIVFEEAREIGDIIVSLDDDKPGFRDLMSLQYAAPAIEWMNSKAYTWYQGQFVDYPVYAERLDNRTFLYRAQMIKTCRLRFIWHPNNFPVSLNDFPKFKVTVNGTCAYKPLSLIVESGLWGKGAANDSISIYNGELAGSAAEGCRRRLDLLVTDRQLPKYTRINPDRTVLTLATAAGQVSLLPLELEKHPYMAIPDFGLLVYQDESLLPEGIRSNPYAGKTIRERVQTMPQRTFEQAEQDIGLKPVMQIKGVTDVFKPFEPKSFLSLPDQRMTRHWNMGLSHLLTFCSELPGGKWDVRIGPYKMFGMESAPIIKMLDLYNQPHIPVGALEVLLDSYSQRTPEGLFTTAEGCMCINYGIREEDSWIPYDPAYILQALADHYFLTRDGGWFAKAAAKVLGCIDWAFGQIEAYRRNGAWDEGLMPPVRMGDVSDWGIYYVGDAIYYLGIKEALRAVASLGPAYAAEADSRQGKLEAYRQAIRKAYRKSIGLSPVVRLKNGTYAPPSATKTYLRGFMSDIWPLGPSNGLRNAWMDIDFPAKLIEAGVFGPDEPETKWLLDCLEDHLVLDSFLMPKKWDEIGQDPVTCARDATSQLTDYDADRDWFAWGGTGWQNGYCPLMQAYLITGEVNAFLRSFYNTYAVEVDPETYWFREHAASVHYPPKTFEEAMFLYRLRSMLVFEHNNTLYLNRCVPDEWFRQGFAVTQMPTRYGVLQMQAACSGDELTIKISLDGKDKPDRLVLRIAGQADAELDLGKNEWIWMGKKP